MDLTGKVAVVTGGGRGLGRAYAAALAGAGAKVVVNDVDAAAARAVVETIRDAGGDAVAHVGVVGDTATADDLVATAVEHHGRLDTMVTNAGILRDRVLWKMSDDDFDDVVRVHLRGTFTCARAAAIRFREQGDGGRLVLAGSPAGQHGNFGQGNYAACKAGITAMARTWAMELARADVTVNCIVPTAATEMTRTIPAFAPHVEALEERGEALPEWLRKGEAFGTPEDVAGLVVFLASDASADVTGQTIGLGGDRLALWSYPDEVAAAYRDGGWTADDIARAYRWSLGRRPQSYGIAPVEEPSA
jgi:NAD(P)-dependent dehydrogenase (short-subunit alcohol dehydrogenase family)